MLDGSCVEYVGLSADRELLANGVNLFIHQDHAYVWLCYTYPPGSYGTLDLELQAPNLEQPLNLHASAQLGEWPSASEELIPKSPESDRWWNQHGWMSNPVWINGMDNSGEEARYRFKNAPARETQLSKGRFGSGEWRIKLTITSIKVAEGDYTVVQFPQDGSTHLLLVD